MDAPERHGSAGEDGEPRYQREPATSAEAGHAGGMGEAAIGGGNIRALIGNPSGH